MSTYSADKMFAAVVTPFKPGSFDVDEAQLRRLLRYFLTADLIRDGIGIIINPEAGEIFNMTRAEKRRSVEIAVEEVGGRAPRLAGAVDG